MHGYSYYYGKLSCCYTVNLVVEHHQLTVVLYCRGLLCIMRPLRCIAFCSIAQYCFVLHSITWYSRMQYCIVSCSIAQYSILYRIVLHSIVQYCIVSCSVAYYTIVQYCIVVKTYVCSSEKKNISCSSDSVIYVDSARFGRMTESTCLKNTGFGHLNCSADVRLYLERKCSGRRSCLLEQDTVLERSNHRCPGDLKTHLEVTYHCLRGNR